MLSDRKILITGLTGQIGHPIARFLARDNEVWGVARFTAEGSRERSETIGVRTHSADLADGNLSDLPMTSPTSSTSPSGRDGRSIMTALFGLTPRPRD